MVYHSISTNAAYRGKSYEEIRLEDYQSGRAGKVSSPPKDCTTKGPLVADQRRIGLEMERVGLDLAAAAETLGLKALEALERAGAVEALTVALSRRAPAAAALAFGASSAPKLSPAAGLYVGGGAIDSTTGKACTIVAQSGSRWIVKNRARIRIRCGAPISSRRTLLCLGPPRRWRRRSAHPRPVSERARPRRPPRHLYSARPRPAPRGRRAAPEPRPLYSARPRPAPRGRRAAPEPRPLYSARPRPAPRVASGERPLYSARPRPAPRGRASTGAARPRPAPRNKGAVAPGTTHNDDGAPAPRSRLRSRPHPVPQSYALSAPRHAIGKDAPEPFAIISGKHCLIERDDNGTVARQEKKETQNIK